MDLFRRVGLARAQMATRALARVLQARAGSLVLEERVRTYIDPVTGLDVEEKQTRYLRPDWRAAAWWLARVFPDQYGPNAKSWDQVLDEFTAQELQAERGRASSAELAGLAERLQLAFVQNTPTPRPPNSPPLSRPLLPDIPDSASHQTAGSRLGTPAGVRSGTRRDPAGRPSLGRAPTSTVTAGPGLSWRRSGPVAAPFAGHALEPEGTPSCTCQARPK
ncbi:hypothetical protein [Streptomyces viridosporus]|uniref:hypothetical protein n=1 Tax=Streptomyces viridosporus TaxID=67581 RepID=UPI0036F85719